MKRYVHARLSSQVRETLDELRAATGQSESELVREGLELVAERYKRRPSALDLAAGSAGKFRDAPRNLSTGAEHLQGFGE